MNKETYNRIKGAVGAFIGLLMAISITRNTWALALVGVLLGMVILYSAKQRLDFVLYDERAKTIKEKAASTTLGLLTFSLAILGIVIVELSYRGYAVDVQTGYNLAFLANIILGANAFFNWYYGKQLGD